MVSKNICYLCGNETGYTNKELADATKIMFQEIIDAWQYLLPEEDNQE